MIARPLSTQRLRHLVGMAALLVCLWLPSLVFASEIEPHSTEATAAEQALPPAKAQTFRAFLPLVDGHRQLSSFELIDQAQARGEIDDETALIYHVFAAFGDSRLPATFHGDNRGIIDSDAVVEARLRYASLSPAARATLGPFLIPPVYRGSWYDLRINGAANTASASPADSSPPIETRCQEIAQGLLIPLESEHFVVWYPPSDDAMWLRAQRASFDLEQRIYPTLTDLLRTPKGDAGLGCNPGDGRLDVYIVTVPGANPGNIAEVWPYTACAGSASYMLVLKEDPDETAVLAHEFMHMIQFTYKPPTTCLPDWWVESTAHWAIDYFERMDPQPDRNLEHGYAANYLDSPYLSLWDNRFSKLRYYGAYLWPFYLTQHQSTYNPDVIARIFADVEGPDGDDLYAVINADIEGGWEARWPEFAFYNLNLPPFNFYEQRDGLTRRWGQWQNAWITDLRLNGKSFLTHYLADGDGDPSFPWPVNNLAISYQEFKIADDVRLLAFANTFVGKQYIHVQALIKRQGQPWQAPENWTGRKWTVLCQDDPAGRVENLIIIISNSNWTADGEIGAPDPYVVASDLSCAGWQGASHWQLAGESSNANSRLTYTLRGDATPTFTLSKRTLTGDVLQLEYQPTAGDTTWSTTWQGQDLQTGQVSSCVRSGGQALAPNLGTMIITEDLGRGTMHRQFFGAGLTPSPDQCPGFESWTHVPWLTTDVQDTGLLPWPTTSPAGRLQGNDSVTEAGDGFSHTTTSSWDFTALDGQ